MTVPLSRLLLGPSRSLNVTVPGVVGVQVKVVGFPAVMEKPAGSVKGFGLPAARAIAMKPLKAQREIRCILIATRRTDLFGL